MAPMTPAAAPNYAPVAPAPLAGALPGSTAADLNGDGVADGYYTADGVYHAFTAPAPAPAPRYVSRRGERG
jgi:hypothetical protein